MEVREEVRQLAVPLADELGFELVDIEQTSLGHHRIVRVYLDKPGGVSIDDCARFSRRLADAMDMNQIVPGRYHLEVSSPGLERPERPLEHVPRFAGQRIQIQTHEARDGTRRWEGELLGPVDGRAGVKTALRRSGATVIEAPPGLLGEACVAAYLRLKARARL